jgi:ribonuclease G
MSKEMFIASSPHETRVAVCEDDLLVELYIERDTDVGLVGGIYKGRVNRVLPGMQSAFVDIGLERDAFLYVSDFSLQGEEFEGVLEELEGRGAAVTLPTEERGPAAAESGAQATPAPVPPTPETSSPGEPRPMAVTATEEAPKIVPPAPDVTPLPSATVPASTVPAERADFRKSHEPPRGHRRRRGRRGFGEHRFTQRSEGWREPQQKVPPAPQHPTFEILPGESLAKYSHSGGPASGGVRASATEPSQPGVEISAEKPHPGDLEPSPDPFASQVGTMAESPETGKAKGGSFDLPPQPAASASEEPPVAAGPEVNPLQEGVLPEDEPGEARAASGSWIEPELSAGEEKRDALEGPAAEAAEPDAPESAAPGEVTPAEGEPSSEAVAGAERQVTLREPNQRPRFAPRRRRGRRGMRDARRPDARQTAPRSSNNQPLKISELLKEGQEILVQIAKEPLGTKGARITSHIALPGRYLVHMPTITHIGVSRRITSEQERLRLRNLILEHRGSLTGGFIVRTAAEGRSEDELKADLKFLTALWNDIRSKAERSKAPALIYRDLDLVQRILRDTLTPDFKSIRVDSEAEYEHVLEFVSNSRPALLPNVKLHTRETPLFEEAGISAEIEKALRPKIWLKSGGYIVINQTEALVAIDVNTGKYVGKTNRLEDTILKTNIDAVKEIVRQIRLRDLGGIIVVDFIDMDERRNRNRVVQALEEALRSDRAPTKVLSFNEFGLVALTRKRVKQSLQRTLCEPCSYCNGGGWVKSPMTVCHEILAEARKMAGGIDGKILTLRVHPEVAKYLKSRDGFPISEIENITRKEVVIKSDPSIHQEQFEIF